MTLLVMMGGQMGRALAGGEGGAAALTYSQKVALIAPANLIGWWKMAEPSGATSTDSSSQANNGAYTGVTLAQTGIGDGLTSASFDGTTSFNNIYSAALNSDFNLSEGTLALWMKVSGVGIWTDATARLLFGIRVDNNNRINIQRSGANGRITYNYIAGAVTKSVNLNGQSTTGWLALALSWSVAGDAVKAYAGGAQTGSTLSGLGTWVGAPLDTNCCIGAENTSPATVFSGYEAHAMLWTTPLSDAQILSLATVP